MFRSKRNAIVKRLWKSRLVSSAETSGGGNSASAVNGYCAAAAAAAATTILSEDCYDATSTARQHHEVLPEAESMKSVALAMLRRLKEVQLRVLLDAVECRGGGEPSGCVLVPGGDLRLNRGAVSPHVLCCQLWRWPDLRHALELKRLACCSAADDDDNGYLCCINPYHWSRLCKPESPPPPYSRCALERFKPEDRAPSEPVSVATGGTNQYGSYNSYHGVDGEEPTPRTYWCNLAYWELRNRVGRLFPVHQPSVNVFSHLPHGDGLCLSALNTASSAATCRDAANTSIGSDNGATTGESVRRTRDKIGYGVALSREPDGVWAYNRSEHPIFVNSPTLQQCPPSGTGNGSSSSSSRSFVVYKVPSGHSIKIFDFDKALHNRRLKEAEATWTGSSGIVSSNATLGNSTGSGWDHDGPFDPNSVRISFAKGWGPKYSRQVITSCPCWLEVLLVVPR